MKCGLILAALVVMLGMASAMKLNKNLMEKLQARAMGDKGKGSGSGDMGGKRPGGGKGKGGDSETEKQEYLTFSAMLAYAALAGKCEQAALYVAGAAEEYNVTFEEAWEGAKDYIPTLYKACPKVKEFMDFHEMADEDTQDKMCEAMAPFGLLLQCSNLFAEVDSMILQGFTNTTEDGTPMSKVMLHGKPLYEGCIKVFGSVEEEADKLNEDLDEVEKVAPSNELRSLLLNLQQLMKKNDL